jgi:hypothetical protein
LARISLDYWWQSDTAAFFMAIFVSVYWLTNQKAPYNKGSE